MMNLLLLLAIISLTALGVQQYAMRKRQQGFSLRYGEQPRRRLGPDDDEEATRRWLESDDDKT